MNIGFVSTRFAGTDGVSLEAQKWAATLESLGHQPFWFSGLNDRPDAISYVVPAAFFEHPAIRAINESVWGLDSIPEDTRNSIDASPLTRHPLRVGRREARCVRGGTPPSRRNRGPYLKYICDQPSAAWGRYVEWGSGGG